MVASLGPEPATRGHRRLTCRAGKEIDRKNGCDIALPAARLTAAADDIIWARGYMVPWVLQHLKRISEEERHAKRPKPGPVFGAPMPPGTVVGHNPRKR